jgi:hypothetical protein
LNDVTKSRLIIGNNSDYLIGDWRRGALSRHHSAFSQIVVRHTAERTEKVVAEY